MNAPSTALAPRREDSRQEPLDLETLGNTAANDATAASQPATIRPPRRRVLSHDEEVELSRRIEAGERDAMYALLGTRLSAQPIRAIASELRSGQVFPSALLRNAEEDSDEDGHAERLARLLDRAANAS
ncbi:MAG: hypothetical protein JOZ69_07875, partial [Myxococcales bacterium]|nr:hypothetical protein [Myxococcales bacterium]